MGGTGVPFETVSSCLPRPKPIAAGINTGTGAWYVAFDRPLQAGILDADNWYLRYLSTRWVPYSAIVLGTDVTGFAAAAGAAVGPDVVSYSPPPYDVIGTNGYAAAAFADFPLGPY